jgi:hypothetical protein
MEILNLFPTPVGISYYPEIDKLQEEIDNLIKEITSEENENKNVYNILSLSGPTIKKFYEFIKNGVNEYSKLIKANSEFDATASWLLINELANPHHHAAEPIVACFYLRGKNRPDIPPVSGFSSIGDISFIDVRGGINLYARDKLNSYGNSAPGKSGSSFFNGVGYYNITPEPGKLVIFPGYLIHLVHQNVSGNDRIVIGSQWDRVFDLEKLDSTKPKTPKATPYWYKTDNLKRYVELKYKK